MNVSFQVGFDSKLVETYEIEKQIQENQRGKFWCKQKTHHLLQQTKLV